MCFGWLTAGSPIGVTSCEAMVHLSMVHLSMVHYCIYKVDLGPYFNESFQVLSASFVLRAWSVNTRADGKSGMLLPHTHCTHRSYQPLTQSTCLTLWAVIESFDSLDPYAYTVCSIPPALGTQHLPKGMHKSLSCPFPLSMLWNLTTVTRTINGHDLDSNAVTAAAPLWVPQAQTPNEAQTLKRQPSVHSPNH